jgi:hypothetical protein
MLSPASFTHGHSVGAHVSPARLTEQCVYVVVGAQQFVVGVEAGVHLGEDGLTLGPLAKGDDGATVEPPMLLCIELQCDESAVRRRKLP